MNEVILTGDRPTGPLHLGHYVGSLANRVALQGQCRQYIVIADMQAITDNAPRTREIVDNIVEVTLDYLSVGIDPSLSTIFIQSQIPALSELTMYLSESCKHCSTSAEPHHQKRDRREEVWR